MVKMKFDKRDFNVRELDIEYEGPQYERYTGDIPRSGTILTARVTKAWMTTSQDGDQMTKMLIVAEGNTGNKKQYNGLPVWERMTWKKEAARRYGAFLANFDLTVRDVFSKMDVERDDDKVGTPINSIGDWVVGSDDALCRIVIKDDPEWGVGIDWDGWLPYDEEAAAEYDEDDDEDEDDEDEPPARPTRAGSRSAKGRAAKSGASSRPGAASSRGRSRDVPDEDDDEDDYEDDDEYDEDEYDEDEYDDEDEDEEPEPPARTRRGSSRSTSRPASRSSGRAPARSSTRRGGVRDNKAAASRATERTRKHGGDDNEPPF